MCLCRFHHVATVHFERMCFEWAYYHCCCSLDFQWTHPSLHICSFHSRLLASRLFALEDEEKQHPLIPQHKCASGRHYVQKQSFFFSSLCWTWTFQWLRDKPVPEALPRSGQDLSAGSLAVLPCSVWSDDVSELPLQKDLRNRAKCSMLIGWIPAVRQ